MTTKGRFFFGVLYYVLNFNWFNCYFVARVKLMRGIEQKMKTLLKWW